MTNEEKNLTPTFCETMFGLDALIVFGIGTAVVGWIAALAVTLVLGTITWAIAKATWERECLDRREQRIKMEIAQMRLDRAKARQ